MVIMIISFQFSTFIIICAKFYYLCRQKILSAKNNY